MESMPTAELPPWPFLPCLCGHDYQEHQGGLGVCVGFGCTCRRFAENDNIGCKLGEPPARTYEEDDVVGYLTDAGRMDGEAVSFVFKGKSGRKAAKARAKKRAKAEKRAATATAVAVVAASWLSKSTDQAIDQLVDSCQEQAKALYGAWDGQNINPSRMLSAAVALEANAKAVRKLVQKIIDSNQVVNRHPTWSGKP